MIKLILLNIRNNKRFFSKVTVIQVSILTLLSFFIFTFVAFDNTLSALSSKMLITNYYKLSSKCDETLFISEFDGINYLFIDSEIGHFSSNFNFQEKHLINNIFLIKNEKWVDELVKNVNKDSSSFILKGHYPQNKNEIAVTSDFLHEYNYSEDNIINETLEVSIDAEHKVELKICGILSNQWNLLWDKQVVLFEEITEELETSIIWIPERRIIPLSFDDTKKIEQIISDKEIKGITYIGQFYYFSYLNKMWDFGQIIYKDITLPLIVAILFLLIILFIKFLNKQKSLFSQMLLVGYRFRQIKLFAILETILFSIFSFCCSLIICSGLLHFAKWFLTLRNISLITNFSTWCQSLLISFAILSAISLLLILITLFNVNSNKIYLYSKK